MTTSPRLSTFVELTTSYRMSAFTRVMNHTPSPVNRLNQPKSINPRSNKRMLPASHLCRRAMINSEYFPVVMTIAAGKYPAWSNVKCSLRAPFCREYVAQGNISEHNDMCVESMLNSGFLNLNFVLVPKSCRHCSYS